LNKELKKSNQIKGIYLFIVMFSTNNLVKIGVVIEKIFRPYTHLT